MTFDPSRKVVHHGEPQLRDVCVDCNNNRLSSADAAMGMFAERHLTAPISVGTAVDLSDPALFRWNLKTLANLQRHGGHDCVGWRRSVNFILGDAAVPAHTDLFFAAWHDLSPGGANGMLEGLNIVHKLDAREARFMFLPGIDPSQLAQDLDGAWALKVGSGIFLVLFWKSDLVTPAHVTFRRIGEARLGCERLGGNGTGHSLQCAHVRDVQSAVSRR